MNKENQLKNQIIELTKEYSKLVHKNNNGWINKSNLSFIPGVTDIPYAGKVFSEEEVVAAVSSSLDFWLTLGSEGESMERELAYFLGVRKSILVNSGSSANLLALSSLTSPLIEEDRRLKWGDEVITCSAGFPTTVAPIFQNGCVPVFVDNDPITGNINTSYLEESFVQGKTKAVMIAHTLGNPFNILKVLEFCKKNNLWLIEDNCDALGSTYSIPKNHLNITFNKNISDINNTDSVTRYTGTWGDLSTQSFYPPHHLTMGEGGAVNFAGSMKLLRPLESMRDWGRDCWCPSGVDATCGKRFSWDLGELPIGYDHKYIYSHLGYNLKPLDIQAAIGRIQLKRLPLFIKQRKDNWLYLRSSLEDLDEFFDFSLPTHATKWTSNGFEWDDSGCKSDCSWFGFMLRVKKNAPFNSSDLARYLDSKKIGSRMLFGGNLLRQPALLQIKKDRPNSFRVIGDHKGSDELMNQAIFLGTYPGLTNDILNYEVDMIRKYCKKEI